MKALVFAAATTVGLWLAPQTFRVNVDAVRVDVLVTDGKVPIAGLTAGNFELRDNGVVQQIESVSVEDVALSVMLALDTSASVAGRPLEDLKKAANAVIGLLTPADRAALMTFTGTAQLRTPWTTDRVALWAGIADARASGATTLHDAAYSALTLRDSQPGRPLVLIFSDGADTASWLPGKNVLDIARRADAVVYAVTLAGAPREMIVDGWKITGSAVTGYRLDFRSGIQGSIAPAKPEILMEPFLDALTADTGGKVLNAERSEQLQDAFVGIVKEFRSRYLLTYTPKGVDAGGWHPIQVTLKGRKGTVTARRGYLR
jgi:VWFA-related protein